LNSQLSGGFRKKKVKDMSLNGWKNITNESRQNQMVLDDLIQDASNFDKKLEKMGVSITIKDLLSDK